MTSLSMRQIYQNGISAKNALAADRTQERYTSALREPAYSSKRLKFDCFFSSFKEITSL